MNEEQKHSAAVENEQAVLGALIIDEEAYDRVAGILREEHFSSAQNQKIFHCITVLRLKNDRVDVISLRDRLMQAGAAPSILGYLNDLSNAVSSAANIKRYASILINHWRMTKIMAIANGVREAASNPKGRMADEIVSDAQGQLSVLLEDATPKSRSYNEILTEVIDRMDRQHSGESAVRGLSTGLADLDRKINGGGLPGQLIILAGRPAMGKSALGLGIADAAAEEGDSLYFTMEMEEIELVQRNTARHGRIPLGQITDARTATSETWDRLHHATVKQMDRKISVQNKPAFSLAEIASIARMKKREGELKCIVVDYLQLMAPGDGFTRNEQVGANTRGLKALAKELGVPIYLLAQLSRKLEERSDKRPVMSDLRDSGEIEQDADVIIMLYRDEVYNLDSQDKGMAELGVVKQRNGGTGIVRVQYQAEFTLFEDLAFEYKERAPEPKKRSRGRDID